MTEHREPEDEGAVEHSTQSFRMTVGPDGVSHTVSMTETFSDGSTRHVDYEDVVVKDDPYVRLRRRIAGEDSPSEVSTEFLASPIRPPTYPAGMPFLAGRQSYTIESPNRSMAPQVRWRCSDPETLLAALTEVLVGDGWARVQVSALPVYLRHEGGPVFARAGAFRVVHRHDWEGGSVVSLHDLTALSGLL